MNGLKRAICWLAIYSGFLFGFATHRIVYEVGYIDRLAVQRYGLSIIGTLFCLLTLRALHRRGLL